MFSLRKKTKLNTTINTEKITNYTHFLEIPLKIVGCWDWYPNPKTELHTILNNVYICMVLFVLTNIPTTLFVNLYFEWVGIMDSLDELADCMPFLVSIAIVCYFVMNREEMYDLIGYMKNNFEYYSANGLTNMTMLLSYRMAKNFAYFYTACTMFSVTMYVLPEIVNLWKKTPLQNWIYTDITRSPFLEFAFIRQCMGQAFVGLAMGQLGVFFASNSILLCGQLDLLCCSLRNVRYTALLQAGVRHAALAATHGDILDDELHNYIYNKAEMTVSQHHYGKTVNKQFRDKTTQFDIYSANYDQATSEALRQCARVCQNINVFTKKFENFVSPLLALRVVQVTLYLCTLLYAATLKFDMVTVEYLAAVALDIFVYCYYGNQIILQADRVSTAAYQSAWHTMGVKPRRLLLNILLANRRPTIVRAGRFLPIDLHTFVVVKYSPPQENDPFCTAQASHILDQSSQKIWTTLPTLARRVGEVNLMFFKLCLACISFVALYDRHPRDDLEWLFYPTGTINALLGAIEWKELSILHTLVNYPLVYRIPHDVFLHHYQDIVFLLHSISERK